MAQAIKGRRSIQQTCSRSEFQAAARAPNQAAAIVIVTAAGPPGSHRNWPQPVWHFNHSSYRLKAQCGSPVTVSCQQPGLPGRLVVARPGAGGRRVTGAAAQLARASATMSILPSTNHLYYRDPHCCLVQATVPLQWHCSQRYAVTPTVMATVAAAGPTGPNSGCSSSQARQSEPQVGIRVNLWPCQCA